MQLPLLLQLTFGIATAIPFVRIGSTELTPRQPAVVEASAGLEGTAIINTALTLEDRSVLGFKDVSAITVINGISFSSNVGIDGVATVVVPRSVVETFPDGVVGIDTSFTSADGNTVAAHGELIVEHGELILRR